MTTATEIIAALLPRRRAPILEKSTGLPHGWGIWLRNAPQRDGPLSRAPIHAIVAAAAARPRPIVAAVPMNRWQAAWSLTWQHGEPPPREERGIRWIARLGTLLLHVGFLALLIFVSLMALPPVREAEDGSRVQLTFIGRGTPGEGGGSGPQPPTPGAEQAAAPAPRPAAKPARKASRPAAQTAAAAAPSPPTPAPPAQAPAPIPPAPQVAQQPATPPQPTPVPQPHPTPPVEQPLQVTETPQPTQAFVLPPVTPAQVQLPAPQVQWQPPAARVREVEVVENQRPVAVQQVAPRAVDIPSPTTPATQVRQREIPNPDPVPEVQAPALQAVRTPSPTPVQLPAATPAQARLRDIPMPPAPVADAAPAAAAASSDTASATAQAEAPQGQADRPPSSQATSTGTSNQANTTASNAGAPPSPVQGGNTAGTQAASPGAGARATDEWGTPGPKRADDWGASNTAQAGNQGNAGQGLNGLFNADGSAKLPDDVAGGRSDRPGAPGSRQQAKIDANNAGTWLDRPKFGYEPTMFDKYWMPGGTLLQDWVRAGIQDLEIPIPGTSKRIKCVVSILQAGGACGVFDPNLNEHPATARPPPDIPVKRNPIPVGS